LLVQPDTLQKSVDHLLTRIGVKIADREWAIWCVENQDVLLSLVSDEGDAPYGLLLWESAVALAQEDGAFWSSVLASASLVSSHVD
jgi:hypothetical protein